MIPLTFHTSRLYLKEALSAHPCLATGARVEQGVVHHADRALLQAVRWYIGLFAGLEHLTHHWQHQNLKQGRVASVDDEQGGIGNIDEEKNTNGVMTDPIYGLSSMDCYNSLVPKTHKTSHWDDKE